MNRDSIIQRLEAIGFREATIGRGQAPDGDPPAQGFRHRRHPDPQENRNFGSLWVSDDSVVASGFYVHIQDAVQPLSSRWRDHPMWRGENLQELLRHLEATYTLDQ